jgi:hypothetical protein
MAVIPKMLDALVFMERRIDVRSIGAAFKPTLELASRRLPFRYAVQFRDIRADFNAFGNIVVDRPVTGNATQPRRPDSITGHVFAVLDRDEVLANPEPIGKLLGQDAVGREVDDRIAGFQEILLDDDVPSLHSHYVKPIRIGMLVYFKDFANFDD